MHGHSVIGLWVREKVGEMIMIAIHLRSFLLIDDEHEDEVIKEA